jgi:hypothetical protein
VTTLDVAASITRAHVPGGPLSDLNLHDGGNFEVVSAGPGSRRWVRDTAAAPSVHGEVQVSARMGMGIAPWVIRCKGSTQGQLETNKANLVAAFSQLSYSLTLTIDGATETWKCWEADITEGDDGTHDKVRLLTNPRRCLFTLQIPRQPVPTVGAM